MVQLTLPKNSQVKVGKTNENEDISTHDLAFPATTDSKKLASQGEPSDSGDTEPLEAEEEETINLDGTGNEA